MAISELMATSELIPENLPALITLKPNQPTESIQLPRARKGILETRMGALLPS